MSDNAVGFRERKTHATATFPLIEGGTVTVGATKVTVPKGKGFAEGFARAMNEAAGAVTATARGDAVELRARVAGEEGNTTATLSWRPVPVEVIGGRTVFVSLGVEVTDDGAKVTERGVHGTLMEAIAQAKGEFVRIVEHMNRPIQRPKTHEYRDVGEGVCASCGRPKDKH